MEELDTQVQAQWAATGATFITLDYQDGGVYSGVGEVSFYGPGRPGTPSWCNWVEERYSFMTHVDGAQVRWGSKFAGEDAALPDGSEDYYDIYEVLYTSADQQWLNLWKMDHAFDLKAVKMTIDTKHEGRFVHSIEETTIEPDPGDETLPDALVLSGAGAEVEGQPFLKLGTGLFRIYAKIGDAPLSFVGDNGNNYYWSVEEGFVAGEGEGLLPATPADADATRITVDLKNQSVTTEVVNKVRIIYSATYEDVFNNVTYQGAGVWRGFGGISWRSMDWGMDERYYFIPTIDGGQSLCWGRLDGVDPEGRPDGEQVAIYFDYAETSFAFDEEHQWEHCWKFASNTDCANNGGKNSTITFYSNNNGVMTHRVTVANE